MSEFAYSSQASPLFSGSDFRQIVRKDATDKADRLFRAATTAYCSLPRPMRADTHQLEDLTLSLYPRVSRETLRYVCAALSECAQPPAVLVSRLVEEEPEICAPLLVRTSVLTDVELIALIARKGLGHARVIARRADLHPTIAALAATLERKEQLSRAHSALVATAAEKGEIIPHPARAVEEQPAAATTGGLDQQLEQLRKRTVAETRQALRLMMRPSRPVQAEGGAYKLLREAALTGSPKLLQAALADTLELDAAGARALVETSDPNGLLAALRTLDLAPEQAFTVTAAAFPTQFPHAVAIRLFHERYAGLDIDLARERLRGLKANAIANTFQSRRRKAG